jgi:cyclopropane fatty-acyl-phospholipid synthase-like methyltransferase
MIMEFIEEWRELHRKGYFPNHAHYQGADRSHSRDLAQIEKYFKLKKEMRCAIIGSGYGRETAFIAPRTAMVYAIDIEPKLQEMMRAHLMPQGIMNWAFILYQNGWADRIPKPVDFVYSINVFQHIARSSALDYLNGFHELMNDESRALIHFVHCLDGGTQEPIKGMIYEPQINWSEAQIKSTLSECGFELLSLDKQALKERKHNFFWYWAFFKIKEEKDGKMGR